MDIILIERLTVNTVIGCLKWERQIEQILLIDLEVHCDLSSASYSDQLNDTLNYVEICKITALTIQEAQPKLIEHAAYLVIKKLFESFLTISLIRMTIRKPAIIAEADSVGVRFERQRNDLCACPGE